MSDKTGEVAGMVLFVDDEEYVLSALRRLFCREPYQCRYVSSGEEALRQLEDCTDVVLIISDQRMPGMSGSEFLIHSRQLVPGATRMIMTGYSDMLSTIEAMNVCGTTRYISKPWDSQELLQLVRETVERYAQHNGQPQELPALQESLELNLAKVADMQSYILDSAPLGIVMVSERTFRWVNPRFCEMLGYQPDELIGLSTRLIYPSQEDFKNLGVRAYSQLAEEGLFAADVVLRRKNGFAFYARLSGRKDCPSDQYSGSVWMVEDVSQLNQLVQESAKQYLRLEEAQRIVHLGSWHCELSTRQLVWSAETFRIFGLDPAILVTLELFFEYVHPDDREMVAAAWAAALDGNTYEIIHRICVGGQIKWVHERAEIFSNGQGEPQYATGTVHDITSRHTAELALEKERTLMRSLLDALPDMVFMKDPDGVYQLCNHRFEQYRNASEAEIIGKTDYDFMSKEQADQCRDTNRTVIQSGSCIRFEKTGIFASDGHQELLEIIKKPVRGSDGQVMGVLSIARNITSQKQTETELQKNRQFLLTLIDLIPGVVGYWGNDLRCKFANVAYQEWFGRTREQMQGISIRELMGEELYKKNEPYISGALQGVPQRFERTLTKADGSVGYTWAHYVPDLDGDSLLGFFVLVTDVTELKQTYQKLEWANAELIQRSEEVGTANASLHTILACMSDWYWEVDTEGRYSFCSAQVEACLGYTPDEMLGTRPYDYMPPEEVSRISPLVADAMERQERIQNLKNWNISKDNQMILLLTNGVPFFDIEGNLAGYRGVGNNITERHNYEQKLETAKEAAESANRYKSEFLANMSHELRTPLNGIIGMTELLKVSSLTEDQQRFIKALDASGTDLLSLIDDVLDLSKIEAEKLELDAYEFNLGQCINSVLLTQKALVHTKGLTFKLDLDSRIPAVLLGDELRIKQILLNLISNAIKFTKLGGISIAVQVLAHQGNTLKLQIAVQDSGMGISNKAIEKIFQPFVQEDGSISRKFGGTGLGLAISQRLARLMGGEITVISSVGKGSCFSLTLPLTIVSEEPDAGDAAVQDELTIAPLQILLVEDNEVNSDYVMTLLQGMGHHVTVAGNGLESLVTLKNKQFDLVLMDIQMPVMNGEQALFEIRRMEQEQGGAFHQPVIALTAHALRGDREALLQKGFDGYLGKPFRKGELLQEIRRVIVV